jgi:AcrR family transcriptional regulator
MLRKRHAEPPPDVARQLVTRVRQAIEAGELGAGDLTARALSAFLGQTTSVLYHHFGSLEGFLYAVSIEGFVVLAGRLAAMQQAGASPQALAEAYVDFGLEQPVLYRLMLEDRYDWAALARAGQALTPAQMGPWNAMIAIFERSGSDDPETDARVFHAAAHGIVLLALTGRMNTGDPDRSHREVALRAIRRLITLMFPDRRPAPKSRTKKS